MAEFRGYPACDCLAEWLPVFEATIGRSPRWFQLVGDAPASAGFHKGGGSADSEPLSESELRIARNMGGAAWNRWWTNNYHAHTRLNGCPHNSIGQPQVADLNAGRDGTGPLYDNAGVPDNGPRDGVLWPLRTWREGIEWALEQGDEMATEEAQKKLDRIIAQGEAAKRRDVALRQIAKSTAEMVEAVAESQQDEAIKRRITKSRADILAAIEALDAEE